MRFWDSSALVPLLVSEPASEATLAELQRDPEITAWWGSEIECVSALARLERGGQLDADGVRVAIGRLDGLAAAWLEVQPVPAIRRVAVRLLRMHPLRAGDAVQLAAAIVMSEQDPVTLPVVTLDDRLAEAASREGFTVVSPSG